MAATTVESAGAPWRSVHARAPGLAGLSGCLALHVANAPAGLMIVEESGLVRISEKGEAVALIATDCEDTLTELLRGDVPPIVAHLQGRLRFEGDAALALRVLFGLQDDSPWAAKTSGRPS
jgi:hypothetical protein